MKTTEPAKVVAQTLKEVVALAREAQDDARERLLDQADTILGALCDLLPTR